MSRPPLSVRPHPVRRILRAAAPLAVALAALLAPPARAYRWEPVPAADLALTTPQVSRGADVEALLWRLTIQDEVEGGTFVATQDQMVRLKLYDQRAVEEHATISIPYTREVHVDELDARTVLPGGRVLAVPREAFFDRDIVRRGKRALRTKSFAPPGLVPGAVVEYHLHVHVVDRYSHYLPIPLQLEYPVRRMELRIHPLDLTDVSMMYRTFQGPGVHFEGEGGGDYVAVLEDRPAFREEPLMPPADQVRQWLLLYYRIGPEAKPATFWRDYGREEHKAFLEATRADGSVRDAALAAVDGAAADTGKVRRLFDWCRAHVRNLSIDTTLTESARARLKPNNTPAQTLARGLGTANDIDMLFAAMARACGLDARKAMINRRTDGRLDFTFTEPYFVRTYDIAVNTAQGWQILDPAAADLPFGMLRWEEEGSTTLITGPDSVLVTATALSGPDCSARTSVADLALGADGALDGTVRVTLTGHLAAERKEDDHDDTPAARLEAWRTDLQAGVGTVDVLDPRIEPAGDPAAPYVFTCRVHAAGYAQRTGRRLFVQPAFFRRNAPALLTATERRTAIAIDFPWSEVDSVRIRLPEGFAAEAQTEPAPLVVRGAGRHTTGYRMLADGRTLLAVRTFDFGEGGVLGLPVSAYPALRQVFTDIRERDAATIALTSATAP